MRDGFQMAKICCPKCNKDVALIVSGISAGSFKEEGLKIIYGDTVFPSGSDKKELECEDCKTKFSVSVHSEPCVLGQGSVIRSGRSC